MFTNRVYLDHNSTSLLDDDVKKNLDFDCANPSSLHFEGRKARGIVEMARANILEAFSAKDSELIFTSSCTEANNTVFHSFPDCVHVVSSIEHASVLKSAKNPVLIPVTEEGTVKLDDLESIIKEIKTKKFLVSVMIANNETGVIQPVSKVSKLVHNYGGIMHTDAAQGCGKIAIDMEKLDVDVMSISGHKFGSLKGVGALLFKKSMGIVPLMSGGGQEKKLRGGMENVLAISSLDCVVRKLSDLIKRMEEKKLLRDKLEEKISDICPQVKIFGKCSERLPNTGCIAMPGNSNDVQLMHFDLSGIAVGKGSACSSGMIEKKSHVLEAMNVSEEEAANSLRISLGYKNNDKDIERFVNIWRVLYNKSDMFSGI
ncbi:MAG: cysteine desulfurase [Rickettsiaceae bacterium H1]|nr:cysteine desulfurase [Rickettsiaceae bacterium H1]